jgi:hypothetical protein
LRDGAPLDYRDRFVDCRRRPRIAISIEKLEAKFGRPAVSVDFITPWRALRTIGVIDLLTGSGPLAHASMTALVTNACPTPRAQIKLCDTGDEM